MSSRSVYSVAFCWRKKTIFAGFWTSAFSDVANWQQSEKVEYGTQPQTFPYPRSSKSFLYSNAFMAKSGAQSLTFKSLMNKQTNKETDKQTKLETVSISEQPQNRQPAQKREAANTREKGKEGGRVR